MMAAVWVGLGVLVLLAIFQRKTLGRFVTALMAQFNKLSRVLWSVDPVAVYQAEVDHSAQEISEATAGLEQYRGLVSRLERQVANGEREEARLTARVRSFLASGDENKAAEYAMQLKKAQVELGENSQQLADYRASYQNNLKKIQFARQKIETAKEKARKLDADLKMSKAEAETARLAEKFNVKTNTLDGLGEIEDEIQRQIDNNRGKAAVSRDLSADGLAEIEADERAQKTEAKELLDKMKSEMGLKS
jgi:phage shock protein A